MLMGQKNNESFPFHHIEYIGSKHGLKGSEVGWIKQDSRGFLWVTTDVAINRYDGYNFQSWSYDEKDTNSISPDFYFGLSEDKSGTLWLLSNLSGIYSFDPMHQKFTKYRHHEGNINSLLDDMAITMAGDDDWIWILTETG
jgi:ligand-binding sensor domain-containing protein